jgi:hypothetical protein
MELLCVAGIFRNGEGDWHAMNPRVYANTPAGRQASKKLKEKLEKTGVYKDVKVTPARIKEILAS